MISRVLFACSFFPFAELKKQKQTPEDYYSKDYDDLDFSFLPELLLNTHTHNARTRPLLFLSPPLSLHFFLSL